MNIFEKIKMFFVKKKEKDIYGAITKEGTFIPSNEDNCCGMGSCKPIGIDSGLNTEEQELEGAVATYEIILGVRKPKKVKRPAPKKYKKKK